MKPDEAAATAVYHLLRRVAPLNGPDDPGDRGWLWLLLALGGSAHWVALAAPPGAGMTPTQPLFVCSATWPVARNGRFRFHPIRGESRCGESV